MAQLMEQAGGGGKAPATPEEMQAQEEQREAAEEQRRAMLMNLMQPSARDRCEPGVLRLGSAPADRAACGGHCRHACGSV